MPSGTRVRSTAKAGFECCFVPSSAAQSKAGIQYAGSELLCSVIPLWKRRENKNTALTTQQQWAPGYVLHSLQCTFASWETHCGCCRKVRLSTAHIARPANLRCSPCVATPWVPVLAALWAWMVRRFWKLGAETGGKCIKK